MLRWFGQSSIGLIFAVTSVASAWAMAPARLPTPTIAPNDVKTCTRGSGYVAIAACSRLLASGPLDDKLVGSIHYTRADLFSKMGDYEGAIADYTVVIGIHPNKKFAFTLRGVARRKAGDYANALADLSEAIRLDPTC